MILVRDFGDELGDEGTAGRLYGETVNGLTGIESYRCFWFEVYINSY